jgi:hypothetical protein
MRKGPDDDIQALIDLRDEQRIEQDMDEKIERERDSWNRDEDNPAEDRD